MPSLSQSKLMHTLKDIATLVQPAAERVAHTSLILHPNITRGVIVMHARKKSNQLRQPLHMSRVIGIKKAI